MLELILATMMALFGGTSQGATTTSGLPQGPVVNPPITSGDSAGGGMHSNNSNGNS